MIRCRQIQLRSGELLFCRDARLVWTVLGSCVAVTMFHPRRKLAAMCHAMLPQPHPTTHHFEIDQDPFKYVACALPAMLEGFHRAGIPAAEIEVKMFGGANVIDMGGEQGSGQGIGDTNVRVAREILEQAGLRLKAADVGGVRGRKIILDTATGGVLHKYLTPRADAPSQPSHFVRHVGV